MNKKNRDLIIALIVIVLIGWLLMMYFAGGRPEPTTKPTPTPKPMPTTQRVVSIY